MAAYEQYQVFLQQAQQLNPNFQINFHQYQDALAYGGLTSPTTFGSMSTPQFQHYFNQVQQAAHDVTQHQTQQAANQAASDNAAAQQVLQTQQAHDQAAADAIAAEAENQRKMAARRDGWDRANNQGAYDADGWQSIGYQPSPIEMPSWWDGPGASTPPPTGAPLPPEPVTLVGPWAPGKPKTTPGLKGPPSSPGGITHSWDWASRKPATTADNTHSWDWASRKPATTADNTHSWDWASRKPATTADNPGGASTNALTQLFGRTGQAATGAPSQNQVPSWAQRPARQTTSVWGQNSGPSNWGTGGRNSTPGQRRMGY